LIESEQGSLRRVVTLQIKFSSSRLRELKLAYGLGVVHPGCI
jgi:hypothetical protein